MTQEECNKLLITVGFSCNNNCLLCSNRKREHDDRSTAQVKELIKEGSLTCSAVEFTGGEPTIRKDFFSLLSFAKEVGFRKIEVSSNLRIFSYEKYAQKAVELGLSSATTTIFGPEKLHDSITRTPKSFIQTKEGYQNLKKRGVIMGINTVISKLNADYIEAVKNVMIDMNPTSIMLLDLIPDGLGRDNYKMLVLSPDKMSHALDVFLNDNALSRNIILYDYPFCVISQKTKDSGAKIRNIVDRDGSGDVAVENVGYGKKKRVTQESSGYNDYHKKKMSFCKTCKYSKACPGFWKESIDIFGEDVIKINAVKNNCL